MNKKRQIVVIVPVAALYALEYWKIINSVSFVLSTICRPVQKKSPPADVQMAWNRKLYNYIFGLSVICKYKIYKFATRSLDVSIVTHACAFLTELQLVY